MLQVSEKEIKNRLIFDNPWWGEPHTIENRFRNMPRRFYFPLFQRIVQDTSINRAVILMGPRRVGKTVMIFHSIQNLLDQGVDSQNIIYLSLETPLYTGLSLERIVLLFREHFHQKKNEQLFIYFDEIQYLKNWEVHLKSLVDSYPDYRFIATGSAAAALRLKSSESGAGRFTDFLLPPLTFAEYLNFINKEDQLINEEKQDPYHPSYTTTDIDELNREFLNYLNYGGYPEAVFSETIQKDSSRYIKSDIIDKVLLRDLPSLYGISDIQELNRLFTTIAYNTGNEITLEGLSKSSGVVKNTLKRYLEYLEAAFLIRRVNRIDSSAKRFRRATSFKVYLTNPSMRAALFGFSDESHSALGALIETAIFGQWFHSAYFEDIYYARWKDGEVDIVSLGGENKKPIWCAEVKWSDRPISDHSLLKNIVHFCKQNPQLVGPALVTTKTKTDHIIIEDIPIDFRPSSEYTYILGKNILMTKSKITPSV